MHGVPMHIGEVPGYSLGLCKFYFACRFLGAFTSKSERQRIWIHGYPRALYIMTISLVMLVWFHILPLVTVTFWAALLPMMSLYAFYLAACWP